MTKPIKEDDGSKKASSNATGKEKIVFTDEKDNWDQVKEVLMANETVGAELTIEMNGITILPADVLETIKGRDVDIVLEMSKDIKWIINGLDVKEAKDTDLEVYLNTDNIPADVLDTVDVNAQKIPVTLKHNGEFGFDAILEITLPNVRDGSHASMFYYDEENKTLTKMEEVVVENGKAKFRFEHASEWLILVDEKHNDEQTAVTEKDDVVEVESAETQEKPLEEIDSNPVTTETVAETNGVLVPWMLVVVVATVLVFAIVGCVVFVVKRKSE